MFCKHEWKVLSETVTKSALEVSAKCNVTGRGLPESIMNTDRKHIQVFTCDKCGKLKRFVEDI